ncbi:MAG TPA: VOC family protein [Candidatus Limnocylindria bacterium]|nr:VOC family protein [Candidatus Limnocylindria bacterium]
MPVLGLHHAQVFYPAGEEARARRFYADQLGLREIPRPRSLQSQPGLWFEVPGGAHVHLAVEPDLALHPRRHFALRVDDLGRMRAALERDGVRSEDATEIAGWQRCYVFDPFGNKIELDQTE